MSWITALEDRRRNERELTGAAHMLAVVARVLHGFVLVEGRPGWTPRPDMEGAGALARRMQRLARKAGLLDWYTEPDEDA